MKNPLYLLLCGLVFMTACHNFPEEAIIPTYQQKSQPSALGKQLQDLAKKLDQFTPSEQVFLQKLHSTYPQYDLFIQEGKEEDIRRLRKLGRIRILEEVSLDARNSSQLLKQSLKAPRSEELFPAYQTAIGEDFPSWSCKEWCIIRAEQHRLSSMSACLAGKGDENECREEMEIRYFYFLTKCQGDC